MSAAPVLCEIEGSVAVVTLNRPEAMNAIDLDLALALADAAARIAGDPAVRAAVLTGAGPKAFCAGGDVAAFAADPEGVGLLLRRITGALNLAVSHFARMDAPLISAVNGVAAGAGFSLAIGADLALAADTARFTAAYTGIGLSPDGGLTHALARIVGIRRAMDICLTNPVFSAAEALDLGLVNRVIPASDLTEEAIILARRLAAGPTRAHGAIKRLLVSAATESLETQLAREAAEISALAATPDGREGVAAFAQKRKPAFTGR